MTNKEFNYLQKCLIDCLNTLPKLKSMHEVYYMKGVISTLEDILYNYCEDGQLDKLNKAVFSTNVYKM